MNLISGASWSPGRLVAVFIERLDPRVVEPAQSTVLTDAIIDEIDELGVVFLDPDSVGLVGDGATDDRQALGIPNAQSLEDHVIGGNGLHSTVFQQPQAPREGIDEDGEVATN